MSEPLCTATLTTATETDEVVAELDRPASVDMYEPCFWDDDIPDGEAFVRRGDRLLRLDLHPLTCDLDSDHTTEHCSGHGHRDKGGGVDWTDDTPGATPHVPTVEVSDAEVEAAARAWIRLDQPDDNPDEWATLWAKGELNFLRAALVAAKQAAQKADR